MLGPPAGSLMVWCVFIALINNQYGDALNDKGLCPDNRPDHPLREPDVGLGGIVLARPRFNLCFIRLAIGWSDY